eukprot:g2376.t1
MIAILLVLEKAIKDDSSLHPLLSSPSSLATILKILKDDDKSVIYQLGEILLGLVDTRSEQTRKAFIPILIDQLQRHVHLEEPPTPFFRDSLILLNSWVRFYRSWTGVEEEEFVDLCIDLVALHPDDVDILRLTYLYLRFRKLQFQFLNTVLFHLIKLTFTKCTTQFRYALENRSIIVWLAAGIMSTIAQDDETLLQLLVDHCLPTIACMVPVIENEDDRNICLLIIDSIMLMLIKASRQRPELMRESSHVLRKMKMQSTWSIKTAIRQVLVNIDQAVDQQIAIRQCSVEDMKLILQEHCIRQECIDRLELDGSQFLRITLSDLAEQLKLNEDETDMVHNTVYSEKIDIYLGGTNSIRL